MGAGGRMAGELGGGEVEGAFVPHLWVPTPMDSAVYTLR